MLAEVQEGIRSARREPAFALYLAAVAALGFRWFAPSSAVIPRSTWSDLFLAASTIGWLWSRVRTRTFPRIRAFHVAPGLYLGAAVMSAAFAVNQALGARTVVLIAELCVIAVLTSEFASDRRRIPAIGLTVCFVVLYTALLAVIGLALSYAGVHSSLIGTYGEQYIPSGAYARIQAGFYSPPLLASFCIFALAVLARWDVLIPGRLRLATQVALFGLVISTLSRGILGFAAGLAIRAGSSTEPLPGPSRRRDGGADLRCVDRRPYGLAGSTLIRHVRRP